MRQQTINLLRILREDSIPVAKEIQKLGDSDPFADFYKQIDEARELHGRYPNEQAENSEQRYKPRHHTDNAFPAIVDTLFSGEESFGRYFDLHSCHESYLNLPNVKRLNYLQYLEQFDNFSSAQGGIKRAEKLTDDYFKYVGQIAEYLVSFRKRAKPLEDTDKMLAKFDADFAASWVKDEIPEWKIESTPVGDGSAAMAEAVWCRDCEKEFKNENVYKGHLAGKKHLRAAEQRRLRLQEKNGGAEGEQGFREWRRSRERAVAAREFRIQKLAASMSTERSDTRVNVERKQGMTERERQQELDNIINSSDSPKEGAEAGSGEDEDGEEKIYNPLKLPLAWDGKPIPFWLYRLHGLGVEFHCEVCGNFVYMGRRAFDKHFAEPRHIYGLKCLGITNVALFRDITRIDEALKLWEKLQQEQKKAKIDDGSIVQMEDGEGNVMPEKVYNDLQKQGLL